MPADVSPLASCLYTGVVQHRRQQPFTHEFRYRLFLAYLDLSELDRVFRGRWLWSTQRPAIAQFRREDYLPETASQPLDVAVRDLVEKQLGTRPSGPIRLLTNLRYWGYLINPISLYYCFDATGSLVEAVVAEVTNTPWGERHCYVLPGPEVDGAQMLAASATWPMLPASGCPPRIWQAETAKDLHVSPFFPMDMQYFWRLSSPGERLSVHIENHRDDKPQFDATLQLERRPMTTSSLAGSLLRHPWMTGKVAAGIYWQALRLKLRGATFFPNPSLTADQILSAKRADVPVRVSPPSDHSTSDHSGADAAPFGTSIPAA